MTTLNRVDSLQNITQYLISQVNQGVRRAVRVKTSKEEIINEENRERSAWHYLTLGIPLLIETLSLFYTGIINREKIGPAFKVRFKHKDKNGQPLPFEQIKHLFLFQNYNNHTSAALNLGEMSKAQQFLNRTLNVAQDALKKGDQFAYQQQLDKMRPYQNLLEKNRNPNLSRTDFKEEDWKTLDTIDFELAGEYFSALCELFNTQAKSSADENVHMFLDLNEMMHNVFSLDYCEAVIAENLSLGLAYIEGLEGKKLKLPVVDHQTKLFRLVEYTIKQTRVGDALPCYLLESEDPDAHPWFVVRGTSSYTGVSSSGKEYRTGAMESILADSLDHECISRNIINKALVTSPIIKEGEALVQKESLSGIFDRWQGAGKKAILCGHSLGGTIVNALTVEFYDQVKITYAFSSAGVSKETSDRWRQLTQQDSAETYKTKLMNFDYEGDFIPSGGRMLIGNHFAIKADKHWSGRGLYDTHVFSHLNHDFRIQRVDIDKEHSKLGRWFCERLRIFVGHCFRLLLAIFSHKYIPDWWTNREVYREYASIERRNHLLNSG